jgi:hypothetical protein
MLRDRESAAAHGRIIAATPADCPAISVVYTTEVADQSRPGPRIGQKSSTNSSAILRVLADGDRLPAVIQCNSGKDRTGIVVALLLELLGVPDETIVADYALTDEVVSRDRWGSADAYVRQAGVEDTVLNAVRTNLLDRYN